MKQIKFLSIIIVIAAMVITACGAEPPATISSADVGLTAAAAAFTIVAETQAAIPTETPLPPTDTPTQTPLATNTPAELPTLAASLTVAPPTATPGGDPCDNRILSSAPNGRPTKLAIINTTRFGITVSVYLNETADKGECGWWTFTLGKKGSTVRDTLVQGCYNIWAWSNDGKVNASGSGCPNNNDKWSFEISASNIKFIGP